MNRIGPEAIKWVQQLNGSASLAAGLALPVRPTNVHEHRDNVVADPWGSPSRSVAERLQLPITGLVQDIYQTDSGRPGALAAARVALAHQPRK